MAKIFKTSDQELALKKINESLKLVANLNAALELSDIKKCKIKLTGMSDSKSVNNTVPAEVILPILREYKKKLKQEIIASAKTYNIEFDEVEQAILGE